MRRPSILWRAILRSERAMPWANAVTTPAPDAASRARRQRWALAATMVPSLSIALLQLIGHRADVWAAWPVWKPLFVQLALVAVGAVLVAALAFGAAAWRRASL